MHLFLTYTEKNNDTMSIDDAYCLSNTGQIIPSALVHFVLTVTQHSFYS